MFDLLSDTRVEDGKEDVGDQLHRDDDESDDEHRRLEDRVVAVERERDELKIKIDTLTEERQLFQRLIGKLEARAKKQKKEGSASQSFFLNSEV